MITATLLLALLAPMPPASTEVRLAALADETLSADYRADLPALSRLRDQALVFAPDPDVGHLAHYWAGFASWRKAMNGAVRGMAKDEQEREVTAAAASFEAALTARPDFADAWAAAASVHGWLLTFHLDDPAWRTEHATRSNQELARAMALAPDNPRVLWVEGGNLLFRPPDKGGDPRRAVEVYRRQAELPLTDKASPWPRWGRPEALMSLAFAHLHFVQDLPAAEEEARAALALVPEWSYVRDFLLPQIEGARSEQSRRRRGPLADLAAIDRLHEADERASRANDHAALEALWTDDVVSLPPGTGILRGRAENAAWLGRVGDATLEVLDYHLDFEEVVVLGDTAYEWGTWRGSFRTPAEAAPVARAGRLMRILRRDAAGWRVARTLYN